MKPVAIIRCDLGIQCRNGVTAHLHSYWARMDTGEEVPINEANAELFVIGKCGELGARLPVEEREGEPTVPCQQSIKQRTKIHAACGTPFMYDEGHDIWYCPTCTKSEP